MNERAIIDFITTTYKGIYTATANGDTFFLYDPEGKFPFATLVTGDHNEKDSNLDRPGVFRLNIGVGKATFRSLFGAPPADTDTNTPLPGYDYTALNQVLPHPVYGRMYWLCILNPSDEMFHTTIRPFLDEAYQLHVARYAKRKQSSE